MIRFIDLGKQIGLDEDWPREFAFYNTVVDDFIKLNGTVVWNNFKEFEQDFKADFGNRYLDYFERLKSLCPEWVFNSENGKLTS